MSSALEQPEPATGSEVPRQPGPRQSGPLRVEPLAALEWSSAIAVNGRITRARNPAEARKAWVHTAEEDQVLALYLASKAADPQTEAPWWLEPLATGAFPSREDAFAVEDRIAKLLFARSGWVYTPWGENGYWEYLPSEKWAPNPTTLQCTNRHEHWIDVLPAHEDSAQPPEPIAVHGTLALRADLGWIEKL
ncbi:hypothetical protein [Sciscionella marina]|uniref:hypothetical protein n=1 Tax=Sciscionella marina TaxID=508770 RepID=UPI001F09BFAC|nr:hypothetical protein [Sciscionella marina]